MVIRLTPSFVAVCRSLSRDSSLYRPNAFKTSSVVIRAEGNAIRDEGREWSGP